MLINSKFFRKYTGILIATSASIIVCDIFFSFYPFPSFLSLLYLLNFILFPYAMICLAITIGFRWKRRILFCMVTLALLSLPSYTYSKIGMYLYFKFHAKEFKYIAETMKAHGIKSLTMNRRPIAIQDCYRDESHRAAINESSACVGAIANDTMVIAKHMRELKIPYIRTRKEILEFKIENLKRGRIWLHYGSSKNDQSLLSDSYIQITDDQFVYYPKGEP